MKSILNIEVSCFANAEAVDPVTVNLLTWLTTDKYLPQQQKVRAAVQAKDDVEKARLKKTMPCITASGLFSYRAKNCLIRHTGFIAIDIDLSKNGTITNYSELKNELCKIPNVAYCGLSVSGTGYFLLIPIAHPAKHEDHFLFIEDWFKGKGLIIDKACKDITRLRFYSYDQDGYFNHAAKPLQAYYRPPVDKPLHSYQSTNTKQNYGTGNVYADAVNWVNSKGVIFEAGQRHNYIFLLCSYLQSKGVKQTDAENWIGKNLMPVTEITGNCISYPFANHTHGEIKAIKQPGTITPQQKEKPAMKPVMPLTPTRPPIPIHEPPQRIFTENWTAEINELETYFAGVQLPTQPVFLNQFTKLTNIPLLIETHFATIKANNGNKTFMPFLNRLQDLKQYCK